VPGLVKAPSLHACSSWPRKDLRPGAGPPPALAGDGGRRDLGDVVLGLPYVQRQCTEQGWDLHARIRLLLAHGICHLLGYRHDTDAEHAEVRAPAYTAAAAAGWLIASFPPSPQMRAHEDHMLRTLGMPLPPPGC
jgi:hypothetical protein